MDKIAQLALLLVALHVVEGALFVERTAYVFAGRRRFIAQGPSRRALGNGGRRFVWLDPWWPPPVGHVAEFDPVAFGVSGVWLAPIQVPLGAPAPAARSLDPSLEVTTEQAAVLAGGQRIARCSSPAAARRLADEIRTHLAAGIDERRRLADRRLASAFDVEAVKARRQVFLHRTRGLALAGPLTFLALVAGLLSVGYVPAAFAAWPAVLAVVVAAWVHLLVETWAAHRALHPDGGPDRALKLLLLALSPGGAARARSMVARDLLIGFHPLAVARALLSASGFEAVAGPMWRDLRNPLGGPGPPELEDARLALLDAHRRLLGEAGVNVSQLEAPPEREGSLAYCPRCHAQYERADGDCEDCPGVARRRFEEPGEARAQATPARSG